MRVWEVDAAADPIEFCYEHGWTDGLPVVPPTEARVRAMLDATRRGPGDVVGEITSIHRPLTVEKIAVNAVMAGCRAEYLPVLIAAVAAMCDPAFNFHGPAASTKSGAPLLILNGPVVRRLDVNARTGVFGPGWRANATLGRAIRLIVRNVGGYLPGQLDRGTMGQPGRYSYCIAENEEDSAWEPLSVERGLPREASAVTVFAGESPHQVNDHYNRRPEDILGNVADAMTSHYNVLTGPGECLVVLGGEHMRDIVGSGWTKADIRRFLFTHARRPLGQLKQRGLIQRPLRPGEEARLEPVVADESAILIVAAGGDGGRFSHIVPCWAGITHSRSVTRRIEA